MPLKALKNSRGAKVVKMIFSSLFADGFEFRQRVCQKRGARGKIVRDGKFTRQFIDIRQTCASPTREPASAN